MRKVEAYFTVEASFILPIVIGVIALIIYLFIFQYDRCLMECAAGVLSIRGCSQPGTSGETLVAQLCAYDEKDDRPYIAWEEETIQIEMKGNVITVNKSGSVLFPFAGIGISEVPAAWSSAVEYQSHRIEPIKFLRRYKLLKGEK